MTDDDLNETTTLQMTIIVPIFPTNKPDNVTERKIPGYGNRGFDDFHGLSMCHRAILGAGQLGDRFPGVLFLFLRFLFLFLLLLVALNVCRGLVTIITPAIAENFDHND